MRARIFLLVNIYLRGISAVLYRPSHMICRPPHSLPTSSEKWEMAENLGFIQPLHMWPPAPWYFQIQYIIDLILLHLLPGKKYFKLKKPKNFKTNWKCPILILIYFFFIWCPHIQPKMISMILMIEWVSYQLPTEGGKALVSDLPNSSLVWPWTSQPLSFPIVLSVNEVT